MYAIYNFIYYKYSNVHLCHMLKQAKSDRQMDDKVIAMRQSAADIKTRFELSLKVIKCSYNTGVT